MCARPSTPAESPGWTISWADRRQDVDSPSRRLEGILCRESLGRRSPTARACYPERIPKASQQRSSHDATPDGGICLGCLSSSFALLGGVFLVKEYRPPSRFGVACGIRPTRSFPFRQGGRAMELTRGFVDLLARRGLRPNRESSGQGSGFRGQDLEFHIYTQVLTPEPRTLNPEPHKLDSSATTFGNQVP